MTDLTTKQMQQILNNNLLNYSDFNILAFDAIKAQTKIMQGFGVDLRKQVVDIEN